MRLLSGKKLLEFARFLWTRLCAKAGNKSRILELLGTEAELTNSLVREKLGLSRRFVVQYMNQLEAEGCVRRVGTSGRFVTYRRTG